MRASSTHRGFTLLEVLVAAAASAIVLVGVVATVKTQQDAFNGGQRVRETQSAARTALLLVEPAVALAGYGIDPVLAFDLTGMPGDPNPPWYAGPCPVAAQPCWKDRVDGSDELVFHARNKEYFADPSSNVVRGNAWQVVNFDPDADQIVLAARAGDLFVKGQILQGVCDQGAGQRYFTVAASAGDASGTPVGPLKADQDLPIALDPDVLTDPFRRQKAGSCPPTRVFLVDRYRYHVRPVQMGTTWDTALVLDRGLDLDGSGAVDENDELIVASGIELLQVAYEFAPDVNVLAGTDNTLPPVGLTPGEIVRVATGTPTTANRAAHTVTRPSFASALEADAQLYERESLYPFRFGPPLAAERATNHLGNVAAVRISVVARSLTTAPVETRGAFVPAAMQGGLGRTNPVFNLNTTPAWMPRGADGRDGNERIRLDTTVQVSNMVSRRLLFQ